MNSWDVPLRLAHHHVLAVDLPNTSNHPRTGCDAIIHPMRRRRADFQKRRARIQQVRHPFTRQHLAA